MHPASSPGLLLFPPIHRSQPGAASSSGPAPGARHRRRGRHSPPRPPPPASFPSAQVAGAAHLGPAPSLSEVRGSHLTGSARPTAPPPAAAQPTEPAVGVPGGRLRALDGSQPPQLRAGSPTAAALSASGCHMKAIGGEPGEGEKLTAARRTLPPRRPSAPTHPSMSSEALPGRGLKVWGGCARGCRRGCAPSSCGRRSRSAAGLHAASCGRHLASPRHTCARGCRKEKIKRGEGSAFSSPQQSPLLGGARPSPGTGRRLPPSRADGRRLPRGPGRGAALPNAGAPAAAAAVGASSSARLSVALREVSRDCATAAAPPGEREGGRGGRKRSGGPRRGLGKESGAERRRVRLAPWGRGRPGPRGREKR